MRLRVTLIVVGICAIIGIQSRAVASTPQAVAYVRAIKLEQWNYFCLGNEADVGTCEASRKIGGADVHMKLASNQVLLAITGPCVPAPVHRAINLTQNVPIASVREVTETLLLLLSSLPQRCKAPSDEKVQKSIYSSVAYLLEFAD